jgi:hypothetical protein
MSQPLISRRAMLPAAGLGLLALGGGLLLPGRARAQERRHAKIRTAITDLRAVHDYLKTASINFGGHKKKAMEAVREAIDELETCLKY